MVLSQPSLLVLLPWELEYSTAAAARPAVPQFPHLPRWSPERGPCPACLACGVQPEGSSGVSEG